MRNIEIDGKKLYGVTKVVKEIKFGDFSNKKVRIDKKEGGIYVSLVPETEVDENELTIYPDLLLDHRNYNDYDLMETKPEPTYNGLRRLLIEFIINWTYERIEDVKQLMLEFDIIFERALVGTNLKDSSRIDALRSIEAHLYDDLQDY